MREGTAMGNVEVLQGFLEEDESAVEVATVGEPVEGPEEGDQSAFNYHSCSLLAHSCSCWQLQSFALFSAFFFSLLTTPHLSLLLFPLCTDLCLPTPLATFVLQLPEDKWARMNSGVRVCQWGGRGS